MAKKKCKICGKSINVNRHGNFCIDCMKCKVCSKPLHPLNRTGVCSRCNTKRASILIKEGYIIIKKSKYDKLIKNDR